MAFQHSSGASASSPDNSGVGGPVNQSSSAPRISSHRHRYHRGSFSGTPAPQRRFGKEDDLPTSLPSDFDYNTKLPPSAFNFPLPVVTSYAYGPSAVSYALQRSPLHVLQKRYEDLREECQTLLDAQSDALMRNSGSSYDSQGKSSRRDKSKRTIPLEEARNGILNAMDALADVKGAEEHEYASEIAEREVRIKTLTSWGKNKEVMEHEIRKIVEGEDGNQLQELRAEKRDTERQIHHLQQLLHQLEMKHASLTSQLSIIESTIASRTSSWNSSIQSLKQKTSSFLATHRQTSPQSAIEAWTLEKEALQEQKENARNEVEALREGIEVWEDVLALVGNFERKLRSRLPSPSPSPSQRSQKEEVLAGIEEVVSKVSHKLKIAEGKNWNLLVTAIATELQAFKEAREMMRRNLAKEEGKSSMTSSFSGRNRERDDEPGLRTDEEADGEEDDKPRSSYEAEERSEKLTEADGLDGAGDPKDTNDKGKLLLVDYSPLDD